MPTHALAQPSLPGFCPVALALDHLSAAGMEQRGAVFTRPEVVGFMLDLIGYTVDASLQRCWASTQLTRLPATTSPSG